MNLSGNSVKNNLWSDFCISKEPCFKVPLISIIILNWNGKHLLDGCLWALRSQTFRDFEVILVDNGSTDGSDIFVRSNYPEVRLVTLGSNLGFCGGNNQGVKVANGEYIFFLNNDTEVAATMLDELAKVAVSDPPQVGSWAVKMMRYDKRNVIDNRGCGYSAFGTGYQIGAGQIDDGSEQDNGLEWVFGPSGGAGCYRRSVLDEIGLFDEDFFFNNEDVDLSFRSQLAGYQCHYVPSAVVYHHGSATGGATSDRTIYYIHRNKEWVFFKNMPGFLMWKYLPFHLAYSTAWVALWVFKGKAKVIFRAKWDALSKWRAVLKKRQLIQSKRQADISCLDGLIDKKHLRDVWRSPSLPFKSIIYRVRQVIP